MNHKNLKEARRGIERYEITELIANSETFFLDPFIQGLGRVNVPRNIFFSNDNFFGFREGKWQKDKGQY